MVFLVTCFEESSFDKLKFVVNCAVADQLFRKSLRLWEMKIKILRGGHPNQNAEMTPDMCDCGEGKICLLNVQHKFSVI